uniref:Uncharacterized protein n=1 Tax=Cacopsylla melanoneura TaxID=428564 RepID=A0A8D8QER5_9HEMI
MSGRSSTWRRVVQGAVRCSSSPVPRTRGSWRCTRRPSRTRSPPPWPRTSSSPASYRATRTFASSATSATFPAWTSRGVRTATCIIPGSMRYLRYPSRRYSGPETTYCPCC